MYGFIFKNLDINEEMRKSFSSRHWIHIPKVDNDEYKTLIEI